MTHLPWKLLGAAAILGLLFDILFFDIHQIGINVVLIQIAFLGITAFLAKQQKQQIEIHTWIAGTFATLFALVFAIWTNSISLTLAGLGLFFANAYFIITLFGHHGHFQHPLQLIRDGWKHIIAPAFSRLAILSHLRIPGKSMRTEVVRGLVIAIPILLVFAGLFLSSDLILQHRTDSFLENINTWLEDGDWVGHLALFLFTSAAFLGIFGAAFWKRMEKIALKGLVKRFETESAIILGGSALLFLGFILFQSVYLFGGQGAWDNIDGITYSEYAVQGFNELAVVAALVILLVLTLRYFHTKASSKWTTILELTLVGETVLLLISAWIRMSLYVEQYGYTAARLYGFWFFVVAAVLLGLLAWHILKKKPLHDYLNEAFVISGIAILIFAAMTPDALSVHLNLRQVTDEKPYDTQHLRYISAEAYQAGAIALSGKYPIAGLLTDEPTDEIHCAYILDPELGHEKSDQLFGEYLGEQISNDLYIRHFANTWDQKWMNGAYQQIDQEWNEDDHSYDYIYEYKWQSWNLFRSILPSDLSNSSEKQPWWPDYYKDICEAREASSTTES